MTTARAEIPPSTLQKIRDSVDVLDVVSRHVTLSKKGQKYWGLCPFHEEKTPSFTVNPTLQMFYCFGCGAGGDVFTFLMRKEGVGFMEMVKELAEQAGIPLPQMGNAGSSSQAGQRKRLIELHTLAKTWFQNNLRDPLKGGSALAYLTTRGLESTTLEEFGIGYAPSSWGELTAYLTRQGAAASDLEVSGLVVAKETHRASKSRRLYDRFRDRIMIPILDLRDNVTAFGGRVLQDGTPKYLNSPETPLFQKGRSLYGLHGSRVTKHKSLILVEGYFDVLTLHQAGIRQAVAPLGTALTSDHAKLLRRFVDTVVLTFDGDTAGTSAVLRALDVFRNSGLTVEVVVMPHGHDPDSYVRTHGAEGFEALQTHAVTLLEFAVTQRLEGATRATIEERTRRVDDILRILAKVSNPIEQLEQIQRVAERLGVRQELLLDRYPVLGKRQQGMSSRGTGSGPIPTRARRHEERQFREERAIVSLLIQGKLPQEHLDALRPQDFRSLLHRRIVEMGLRHRDAEGCLDVTEFLADVNVHDDSRDVVAELAASDAHCDDQHEYVQGWLRALEQRNVSTCLDELIAQLRMAEREQRIDDVTRLNSEIETLRERKAGLATSTPSSR